MITQAFLRCIVAIVLTTLGLATASPQKRPNILIAVADDWSYGHAGAYGCDWVKTPAFDHVARTGILFTRAYTPTAKCCESLRNFQQRTMLGDRSTAGWTSESDFDPIFSEKP